MSAIKDIVRSVADNLKADATFAEDGSPVLAADAYERNLAEGLTLEGRKAYEKNDNVFICASALAFGELSTDKMVANKDLEQTAARVTMGTANLDLGFKRSVEVSDGKGGRQVNQGAVSVKYRATAHLTSIKAHLKANAAELLK
jgi:hypothetical protein